MGRESIKQNEPEETGSKEDVGKLILKVIDKLPPEKVEELSARIDRWDEQYEERQREIISYLKKLAANKQIKNMQEGFKPKPKSGWEKAQEAAWKEGSMRNKTNEKYAAGQEGQFSAGSDLSPEAAMEATEKLRISKIITEVIGVAMSEKFGGGKIENVQPEQARIFQEKTGFELKKVLGVIEREAGTIKKDKMEYIARQLIDLKNVQDAYKKKRE